MNPSKSKPPETKLPGVNRPHRKPPGSITLLLQGLCNVDEAKTKEFWDLFFPRLVRVANRILGSYQDAEDAAQESLVKFWTKATKDKAAFDMDRFGLWAFLSKITVRQAKDFLKYRSRQKRGGGKVYSESDLKSTFGKGDWDLDNVIGELGFHAFDLLLEELLESLSEEDRSIVVWKLMGYTNHEVSQKLECSERHVRRQMVKIRKHFDEDADSAK